METPRGKAGRGVSGKLERINNADIFLYLYIICIEMGDDEGGWGMSSVRVSSGVHCPNKRYISGYQWVVISAT
jgi:hypothetical protein